MWSFFFSTWVYCFLFQTSLLALHILPDLRHTAPFPSALAACHPVPAVRQAWRHSIHIPRTLICHPSHVEQPRPVRIPSALVALVTHTGLTAIRRFTVQHRHSHLIHLVYRGTNQVLTPWTLFLLIKVKDSQQMADHQYTCSLLTTLAIQRVCDLMN